LAQEVSKQQPAEFSISEVVDHHVGAKLAEAGVAPAPRADDANVLRRTMLDLVGRIPTAAEARAYLADPASDKRVVLVDRLLTTSGFVRHQANELNALLMAGANGEMLDYLRTAVSEKRPWDAMFRDMLAPTADQSSGASRFLKSRIRELDKLTNDASVVFFGVNVSCAQCHDHPLVPAWSQEHFFGMKSFFGRSFESGDFVGERDHGSVTFQTTSGEEKTATLMFLSGTMAAEPPSPELTDEQRKQERQLLEQLKREKKPPSPPSFSRRAQLVEIALRDGEDAYFSRSIVNRLWYRLFGRGLVHPIDQMHPANPPSHPELLDWLARDLVEHGYDLQRLLRGLVLSETYSRSSRRESGDHPPPELFAVASLRPLTPAQYATSLKLASMSPDWFPADANSAEFQQQIEQVENSARGFANLIEQPSEDFQVSIAEALLFNNSAQIASDLLRDGGDSLVGKLKSLDDSQARIETAAWNILSRSVAPEEASLLRQLFDQDAADRLASAQHLVWVLLTSSESRFNY